jgi:hypothetical protein
MTANPGQSDGVTEPEFNASIRFGQRVQVQSSIPAASKQWDIISLSDELESLVPGGAWRTRVSLVPPGVLQVK